MKELILIGAEDGLVNQRIQDYAFQLGYRQAESISKYVEFELDGYVDGEVIDYIALEKRKAKVMETE